MSARTVMCAKLGRELPGLDAPPFSGPLGEEVYNRVSEQAWKMWSDDMMIKIINEYRLNLIEAADYERLLEQMKLFLNLGDGGENVLEVENASRGKGA